MSRVVDRRLNGKRKSAVNRQRFIRRFRAQIRKAAADAVAGREVTDTRSGEKINIPARDISEPVFRHGTGGRREAVHPGNREFVTGDRIRRPPGGAGRRGTGRPSDQEGGEDTFTFELSRDEFMEFFFEDLELPDLVKTQLKEVLAYQSVRAGYSRDGVPSNISVVRSLRGALGRRIALAAPYREALREAEAEIESLRDTPAAAAQRIAELEAEIRRLHHRIAIIPFLDKVDLRYHNRVRVARPTTQAVMFCLMDVSGSMDESRKDIAKRFFILLYLFLQRRYERIDVVFIRHHATAKEVDEEEFFHARESGGTVVSSALKLMIEIVAKRYPVEDWNIYAAQASDGDNWNNDSERCRNILIRRILPFTQYYAYVEIGSEQPQSLWQAYTEVAARRENFAMRRILRPADIYPVLRKLLRKRAA